MSILARDEEIRLYAAQVAATFYRGLGNDSDADEVIAFARAVEHYIRTGHVPASADP